ncbi:ferrochelatase [Pelistega sp. NLN82]|uniref:Ferrochelatase n=1 Tax=Pelistega ratti TaxID=2652177 RepID=A0A6L9Y3K3_9BURK|nr:ferrochelatase [Pelistega ratti]NEN75000.1 ferrochelatase [Pelistega ratti]
MNNNPIGVLLVNLGTPASPTVKDIRRYLKAFLSDPRVVELPKWLWQGVLHTIVLPFRAPKLVEKYEVIWLKEGSPLLVYTQAQSQALAQQLASDHVIVDFAMRYGEPDLAKAIQGLQQKGCERILIVPMYPQYAASTTATLFDRVAEISKTMRNQPDYRFIKRYAEHPAYIQSLHHKVAHFWQENGRPDQLLLSFHGLPQRSVDLGDPYYDDCQKTAEALRVSLQAEGVPIAVSFQSQFGKAKWIGPATQATLESYPAKGIKRVDVMCPGFAADCLETLEEIQLGCAEAFKQKGGEQFRYIPCLNDDPVWIDALATIVKERLGSWT